MFVFGPMWNGEPSSARTDVSAAMWARIPATAAVRSIFGTARGSTNQTGVNCYYTSGNVLHFEAADGSAPAIMSADHGGSITANTWTFIGLSMNEAAGANGFAFAINDDVDLFTSTYATPSTNNATAEKTLRMMRSPDRRQLRHTFWVAKPSRVVTRDQSFAARTLAAFKSATNASNSPPLASSSGRRSK